MKETLQCCLATAQVAQEGLLYGASYPTQTNSVAHGHTYLCHPVTRLWVLISSLLACLFLKLVLRQTLRYTCLEACVQTPLLPPLLLRTGLWMPHTPTICS